MRDLGRCYEIGEGVEEDINKALEWYEKALEELHDEELERKVIFIQMMFG